MLLHFQIKLSVHLTFDPHTFCFFSRNFYHVGFQLNIFNPYRRFFGTARKGLAVCMHPCFRRWVPRKPCSSKSKKGAEVMRIFVDGWNFRTWFEHHFSIVFCVFLFDLILKKMIWQFHQLLHGFYFFVAYFCLSDTGWKLALMGSTQVRPENLSLFRGTRIPDVPPWKPYYSDYSDTDGWQEMRPHGVLYSHPNFWLRTRSNVFLIYNVKTTLSYR